LIARGWEFLSNARHRHFGFLYKATLRHKGPKAGNATESGANATFIKDPGPYSLHLNTFRG
jgi:hypothetical protein